MKFSEGVTSSLPARNAAKLVKYEFTNGLDWCEGWRAPGLRRFSFPSQCTKLIPFECTRRSEHNLSSHMSEQKSSHKHLRTICCWQLFEFRSKTYSLRRRAQFSHLRYPCNINVEVGLMHGTVLSCAYMPYSHNSWHHLLLLYICAFVRLSHQATILNKQTTVSVCKSSNHSYSSLQFASVGHVFLMFLPHFAAVRLFWGSFPLIIAGQCPNK